KDSKAAGMTLRAIEEVLKDAGAQVVGLVRMDVRLTAPHPGRKVRPGDILVIEAEVDALAAVLSSLGLKLEEAVKEPPAEREAREPEEPRSEDEEIVLGELAVVPRSNLVGLSASDIALRTRYGINLLAVSREGHRSTARLRTMRL